MIESDKKSLDENEYDVKKWFRPQSWASEDNALKRSRSAHWILQITKAKFNNYERQFCRHFNCARYSWKSHPPLLPFWCCLGPKTHACNSHLGEEARGDRMTIIITWAYPKGSPSLKLPFTFVREFSHKSPCLLSQRTRTYAPSQHMVKNGVFVSSDVLGMYDFLYAQTTFLQ